MNPRHSPAPKFVRKSIAHWGDRTIEPGQRRQLRLEAGESFSGTQVKLPVLVWRGPQPGPVVGITAAIHGDEINGTGAVLRLIQERPLIPVHGSLLLVPVVNILGYERHSRYTPDRRDLNRSFPGNAAGSLSARQARLVFDEIISRCDYIIDLHTAAVRRTNFPNVRADVARPEVERLARAFGCEVVVNGVGPDGSLRRSACEHGVPTIVIEAGEPWKVEPSVQELTLRGIANVLSELGVVDTCPLPPPHQVIVEETRWVRAGCGGFLQFHVKPGDTVTAGQALATNSGLLGRQQEIILSPHDGLVLGMTTMPAVVPGDPVVHIALPSTGRQFRQVEKGIASLQGDAIESQVREHLATSFTVVHVDEET
ncbi:succinylglutamate desuccinylase/aspartoacylase family protein [Haloferula sargassicola]|uniref:Succinylglutamate desuccinylase/Aspartoacylase catalytic domain-containing protein n=1 Tax=Haloferula sargassicola TaxID=490096 RepID=A0ABP9UJV8_9BACT